MRLVVTKNIFLSPLTLLFLLLVNMSVAAAVTPIPNNATFTAAIAACLAEAPVDGKCTNYGTVTTSYGEMPDWDTSLVTDMSSAFDNQLNDKPNFNADISAWNTSNVTDMNGMFFYARAFNQDIGGWDTGNVTNMLSMLRFTDNFNQDIGAWDTSNVTRMDWMFRGALVFNQDISGWDTSKVTTFGRMFRDARAFNQNIAVWDISSIGVGSFTDMFSGATAMQTAYSGSMGFASTPTSLFFDPTVTITAAEVIDGGTSTDSTISLTFTTSEATSNFVAGDITVTNGSISNFLAVSSTVYTATLTPTANGATTIDVAAGTFTGANNNDNAAASQFNWTFDGPPTMSISAAEVSDGDSSGDSSLSMTFTSSEVTADFAAGDITVTNGSISNFVAVSSTVYTATFTPTTMGATTIDVAAGTFTDTAGNNNTAAAQFNWTYSLDPTLKADVVAGLLSKELMAYQFYKGSIDSVNNRLAWLASRRGNSKTSKQGIAFKFTDPVLNQMLNSSSKRLRDYDEADIAAFASTLGGHSELYQDTLKAEAVSLGIAELKAKTGGANLNPELESMNNGWSIWSDGEISFGKNGASTMASSREFNRTLITVGFDKGHNRNSLLGFALSISQEDADIGSDGSNIQSDNIGATLYTSLTLENYSQIEASIGQADLTFDTKRIDGSEVLTGERKGSVYYGSIGLRPSEISHDGGLTFRTHARLNLGQIILDQYSEGGGSMALNYLEQRIDYEELDTSFETSMEKSWGAITLRPRAMVNYTHFLNKSSTASMHYVSSSQVYSLTVPTEMESGWGVSTAIDAFNGGNLSSSLALSRSQLNSENYTNSITFGLRYSF